MIYEVKVRVVQEGTVFVEAETQEEAKKAATSDSVVSKPGFADVIAPTFFDMQKVLRKKTKMSKNNAETCARIHVGRFIRNITKELNKRNGEE